MPNVIQNPKINFAYTEKMERERLNPENQIIPKAKNDIIKVLAFIIFVVVAITVVAILTANFYEKNETRKKRAGVPELEIGLTQPERQNVEEVAQPERGEIGPQQSVRILL